MKLHIVLTAILLGVTLKLAVCKQKLYILGLYPKSGDGWTEPFVEYSAELALKHITEIMEVFSQTTKLKLIGRTRNVTEE